MRPIRLLALCAVFLVACSANVHANDGSKTVRVWIFNVYESGIMRNKVNAYFAHLSDKTGFQYTIDISSDTTQLLKDCHSGSPGIVMASLSVTDLVASQCGYVHIAKTYQDIYLFEKKKPYRKPPASALNVGLIRRTKSADIAQSELIAVKPHDKGISYKGISYDTMFDMVKNYKKDKLDNVVLAMSIINAAPVFAKVWRPIKKFEGKGIATVAVSTHLPEGFIRTLQAQLLTNDAMSKMVWQDHIGIGAFVEYQ